jgi:hypothetical protein
MRPVSSPMQSPPRRDEPSHGPIVASTALGSVLYLDSETHRADSDSEAGKLAQGLAAQIRQFAVSQGWISPEAIR